MAAGAAALALAAERVRPPMPKITAPVMFETPEADRILEAMQVFPPDNPWNQDICALPVAKDSAQIVASIGADKNLGYNLDMGFILVPPDQKRVPVKLVDYPQDSDPGPYPVPDNAPIENWPLAVNEDKGALTKPGQTLEDLQRNGTGDRHVIVVDPVNGKLYEFWQGRKTDAGWQALERGDLRPEDGRPAARALDLLRRRRPAHLPRGRALRRVRARDGRARDALHGAPHPPRLRAARHALGEPQLRPGPSRGWASASGCRASFDTSGFPKHARAILEGLKTYGMFVADNGSDWLMSISPDRRLEGLETLKRVKGSDFEVVDTGARFVEDTPK